MTTSLFKIPGSATLETAFHDLHLWAWANSQTVRKDVTVANYLKFAGFEVGVHHLSEDESKVVRYGIDQWHHSTPWIRERRKITELFAQNEHSTFWVRDKPGVYTPSQELLGALVDSGWIYNITSDTTYFEVIEDRLYAKYQTILGSRLVAKIKPEEVVKVRAPYGSKTAAKNLKVK